MILITIDFSHFLSVFSLVLVLIEKSYQTLKTVFDHISTFFEVCQKYSAVHHVFYSLGVWKCVHVVSHI